MVEWGMVLLCKGEHVKWLPMWLGGGCRKREGTTHCSILLHNRGLWGKFRMRLIDSSKKKICRWLHKHTSICVGYCMWQQFLLL